MRDRGVSLVKDLVEPSQKFEEYIGKQAIGDYVNDFEVKKQMEEAAPKFQALETFYFELESLYKHHMGKKPNNGF